MLSGTRDKIRWWRELRKERGGFASLTTALTSVSGTVTAAGIISGGKGMGIPITWVGRRMVQGVFAKMDIDPFLWVGAESKNIDSLWRSSSVVPWNGGKLSITETATGSIIAPRTWNCGLVTMVVALLMPTAEHVPASIASPAGSAYLA